MHKLIPAAAVASIAGLASAQTQRDLAYQAELLADADSRTSLLAANGQAGYAPGKGAGISDGTNSLYLGVYQNFRYIASFRESTTPFSNDGTTLGFQNRATRLTARGNVGSEDLGYKIQGEFKDKTAESESDPSESGKFSLLDAHATYRVNDDVTIKFGQFKLPLLGAHHQLSNGTTLGIERSITNQFFSPSRSQGVQLAWTGDDVQLLGALSDGVRTANTDFDSSGEADFAFTGRANWKLAGDWSSFKTASSFQGSDDAVYVGGALHVQMGGETGVAGGGNTTDTDLIIYTADGAWKSDGWNARATFVGLHADPATGPEFDLFGTNIQGGYFITSDVELYAMWDCLSLDSSFGLSEDFQNFLTFGARYFPIHESHAIIVAGDIVVALQETVELTGVSARGTSSGFLPNTGVGLIGNRGSNEVAVRLSVRLTF